MGIKSKVPGFPWWSSGQESVFQCRGHGGSILGGGYKIPHAVGQLSWCTTAREARVPQLEKIEAPHHNEDNKEKNKKKRVKVSASGVTLFRALGRYGTAFHFRFLFSRAANCLFQFFRW